ncbi:MULTISPECIES: tetratricopeptide repeat protein [Deinococcus]|uniref:Tetratricopeptide TPR_2 n=1 Tax=Deinococcus geothermalis (strain DSM 11300 / CIP 105573 / AG-3a) TaxID=319795 RepID=Q1J053_DEIGD|nr:MULTISPECIES: tetratricopeptide repeat protein [Deinococcus]ABF45131.1 Tetratricopeptide TPR_2 [Deinococcus geothermalis DSM 11300]MBI0444414.1 tetratricopeptide repeat protein [Deinococcus sp. DB0503]TDE87619.1 tetratricopeptide repeat protein [Deinococcus sp. S9]
MKQRTLGLLLAAATLTGAVAQTQPTAPAPAQPAAPAAPATAPAVPSRPTRPAANYVALGIFYYQQGKFDEAYVAFRAATELDPKNAEALLGLGRSQVKLRLYAPAIETLRRLIALDPQNISGYIALSQAYQQQFIGASDRAAVSGNLAEALRVLERAEAAVQAQGGESKNLNLSKIWNERGYVYRLQGDAGKAIDAFKQASALNPDNDVILFNLGDMYYATGNLMAALGSLQQAVIAAPSDAYNRAYYAKLLALSGNTAAAKPEAAQAARLAPNNAYAVGQYGVVSYLSRDSATARAQLTQAVKLDPLRYPEFYYYLGRLDLDAGDLKSARENLTRAVALGSTTAEYVYYLGLSYERGTGTIAPDRLKARENYERALKLSPNYTLAKEGLARVR